MAQTPDAPGCFFYLFLTTSVNGPTVKDATSLTQATSGQTTLADVGGGGYVQQDRSGQLNGRRYWCATLTP